MPYNDLLEDEDELDLGMDEGSGAAMPGGGMPNVPRNPDREDPRQKIKEYLKRQEIRNTPESRRMDSKSLDELRGADRDINLINLFQQAAAGMGTVAGGKTPSAAPFADFSKKLMAQNQGLRGDIMGQRQAAQGDEDRQMKIRQYMADRMMSDEQKAAQAANQAAALKERQASRASTEAHRDRMAGIQEKALGIKAGKEKEPTEGERKFGAFANRAQSANDAYEAFIQQNPKAGQMGTKDMLIGKYAGDLAGGLMSDDAKMSQQLEKEFIGSVLRPETGAAASDDEWAMYGKKYFPRAGDTPEILARKALVRKQDIDTMRTIAGRGASQMPQTQMAAQPAAPGTGGGTSTPPPVAGAVTGGGGLSPEEQAELDELERQFGGQ